MVHCRDAGILEYRAMWMTRVGFPGTAGAEMAALYCATELS